MKKILITLSTILLLTGCAEEYNMVYRTTDYDYKYEFAKECFARGKYTFAVPLLQELITIEKGTDNAEECLFMLGMAEFGMKDYETASEIFKRYYQTYPRGRYAEMASYYIGLSYMKVRRNHGWIKHEPLPQLPHFRITWTSFPADE